jgi:hypothetical protein
MHLKRHFLRIHCSDSDSIQHLVNKDFAVANFPGSGCFDNDIDLLCPRVIRNHQFPVLLGQKIDGIGICLDTLRFPLL